MLILNKILTAREIFAMGDRIGMMPVTEAGIIYLAKLAFRERGLDPKPDRCYTVTYTTHLNLKTVQVV